MHALEPAWQALQRDFDSACLDAANQARLEITRDLNQIFRRLRHYQNEEQWVSAVRDGAAKFASDFGIFVQKDSVFVLRAQQNLGVPGDLEVPPSAARAFASAVESKEPVVALRTPGEVGDPLTAGQNSARAHLFPITNAGRVVALIFAAEGKLLDLDALELVAGMGAAVLERRSNQSIHSQIGPAPTSNPQSESQQPEKPKPLPAWSDLNQNQRALHSKAQRFSRVAVAEMQLTRPEACRAGREQNNIYMFLQSEIDKAREQYRKQFMSVPSMLDYLHLELVNTAAAGDELKLGADYPGQLL
jgi:hypothetical protein